MDSLGKAIRIATKAHQGQVDKAGAPYILHPLRVMLKMSSEAEMIAAVLHDVIEDTDWTLQNLKNEGFSEDVLEAISFLTKKGSEESYDEFIERAKLNPIARKIKLADLEDNLNIKRINTIGEKDIVRLKKYHRAWWKLMKTENTNPSSSY